MAVGEKITSARMAGLMRNVNQLENAHSYSIVSDIHDSDIILSVGASLASDSSTKVFVAFRSGGNLATIQSFNLDLTGQTEIISAGPDDGEVYMITGMDCNESGDLWISDDRIDTSVWESSARLQKFDTSGSLQSKIEEIDTSGPTRIYIYRNVKALRDGGCVAILETHHQSPGSGSGNPEKMEILINGSDVVLEVDPNSTTTGDIIDIWDIHLDKDDNIVALLAEKAEAGYDPLGRWHVYDSGGTLLYEIPYRTTLPSGPPYYKYYNQGVRQIMGDNIVCYATSGISFFTLEGENLGVSAPASGAVYAVASGADGDLYAVTYHTISGPTLERTSLTSDPQTTFKRYPSRGFTSGHVSLGTPDFGKSVPSDSALVGFRPHSFEIRDVREALEAVAKYYRKARIADGFTTSTSEDNLVDSTASFTESVTVGDTVLNQTARTTTTVLTVDSDTSLGLNDNIMEDEDEYSIQATTYTTTAGNRNIFSLAIDSDQSGWTDTVVTGSRIRDTDYTDLSAVIDYLRKSTFQ